ncbi:MAG: phosphomannomutase [Devosia sp.]|uniref:phosphomannomutase n=1 Tax=Devosia sp. TaxID=1871048 RepID=UPI0024CC599B|nr:phosphomannomutase [Devosia sp.]UYO00568.1 MAG: phosphomannomutase [Devosia sp.]
MSDLKFGTSGLRGLVTDLAGHQAQRYARAFCRYLQENGRTGNGAVYLGRDYRPSSPGILADCAAGIADAGLIPIDCGDVPTPALALHAQSRGGSAIMVTGSHIPADRNGLKFYSPAGEISKTDEAGIISHLGEGAMLPAAVGLASEHNETRTRYFDRYASLLPKAALSGLRIGIFEHSSVARDDLARVLDHHGAETIQLGRSDEFVPVDTEAFDDAVFAPLKLWLHEFKLDAIVSADGDGDRPLLMDSGGDFVPGDVLGLVAARFLGANTVVTPVTSNSAIERTGYFTATVRTRVGSPYVVEGLEAAGDGAVGFEANGGTFVGNGVTVSGRALAPLPTRDAILPLLSVFGLAARERVSVRDLVATLPVRPTAAGRLQDVSIPACRDFLARLEKGGGFAAAVLAPHRVGHISAIDGVRFTMVSGDVVHFRASGNAPEMRCYVEAATPKAAQALLVWGLDVLRRELRA